MAISTYLIRPFNRVFRSDLHRASSIHTSMRDLANLSYSDSIQIKEAVAINLANRLGKELSLSARMTLSVFFNRDTIIDSFCKATEIHPSAQPFVKELLTNCRPDQLNHIAVLTQSVYIFRNAINDPKILRVTILTLASQKPEAFEMIKRDLTADEIRDIIKKATQDIKSRASSLPNSPPEFYAEYVFKSISKSVKVVWEAVYREVEGTEACYEPININDFSMDVSASTNQDIRTHGGYRWSKPVIKKELVTPARASYEYSDEDVAKAISMINQHSAPEKVLDKMEAINPELAKLIHRRANKR